jgi:transketolase
VVIVGTGSGLAYGDLGATHHSCEDVGFLRLLPHMTVLCPGDPVEVRLALRAALALDGPVYLRLGKKGEPVVHATPPAFTVGRGITLREGADAVIVSTGAMLATAVACAGALGAQGIETGVVSMHTVKPLDTELLEHLFSTVPLVVTLEEHSAIGGLGGAVAECLGDRGGSAAFLRIGTRDTFLHEAGDQDYARRAMGLDEATVVERIAKRHADLARPGAGS